VFVLAFAGYTDPSVVVCTVFPRVSGPCIAYGEYEGVGRGDVHIDLVQAWVELVAYEVAFHTCVVAPTGCFVGGGNGGEVDLVGIVASLQVGRMLSLRGYGIGFRRDRGWVVVVGRRRRD
jgi:hypothetical protein